MASDGTYRGGRRANSGPAPKPLADKIADGNYAEMLTFEGNDIAAPDVYIDTPDIEGVDMPKPSDYLKTEQRDGSKLGADVILDETYKFLARFNCDKLVSKRLVEGYAMSFARFIQCEEAISKFGLVGKHPTTGAPIASPFVSMSQSFQKQANLLWYEIFNVVKANSTTAVNGNPQDDIMEALLTQKGM